MVLDTKGWPTLALLRTLTLAEWRAHPGRQVLAIVAVALGVALAFAVHLVNNSALAEFSAAVRSANGQPDVTLACGVHAGCDDALAETLAIDPSVEVVSPVVEVDTYALDRDGRRVTLRVLGIDALRVAAVAPDLLPRPAAGAERLALVDPEALFLNPAAQRRLGVAVGNAVALQHGSTTVARRIAGSLAAGGPPLAATDIAGAQIDFGFAQRVTRIDLRLAPGAAAPRVDAPWRIARADDALARVSQLSRAYRVNLTVLALVALVVGGFLVFSVLALSVAQHTPSLALLGVLGLARDERAALVRAQCLAIGVAGSVLGLGVGTALAQFALTHLAGDLGGGYFPGVAPSLQWSWPAALAFGGAGVAAALVGGWWPARHAALLAPAQALKGPGGTATEGLPRWAAPALLALGTLLAFAPPIAGLPIAAYAGVALLLVGGIVLVPGVIGLALRGTPSGALGLLAMQRARHERHAATVAVSGVVASLALAVALTTMVASFRDGVARWLDTVLPADLYLRSATTSTAADQAWLPPALIGAARALPGITRIEATRSRPISFDPTQPNVSLVARPLADPAAQLPLRGALRPPDAARIGVFVSEAVQRLYDAEPGRELALPLGTATLKVVVRGIWRDYARPFGAIAIDLDDYRRATGDARLNDLALWLAPGASASTVQAALREATNNAGGGAALYDIVSAPRLRALSLAIFDRSFAVTTLLQTLAIGIGLAGVAASFSAQALARRREFGLLRHLGLTRGECLALVVGEALAWTAVGALVGVATGLAISLVLIHVVNPQSFHWTMELRVPWRALAALVAAVIAAGVATAALSARSLVRRGAAGDLVAAVKEEW